MSRKVISKSFGVLDTPIDAISVPDMPSVAPASALLQKIKAYLSDLQSEFSNGGASLLPWSEIGTGENNRFSRDSSGCVLPAFVNVGRILLEDRKTKLPFRTSIGDRFNREEFPCILPFREASGICFEGETEALVNQAQFCVLRLLLFVHPNYVKFTLVDMVTMGRAMKLLSPLRSVLDFSVLINDAQLESFLGQLQEEVLEKNTTTLSKYDWLWQYNEENPAAAEPYRIVMFSSGKEGIGPKSAQLLKQLMLRGNAARAGIYFLLCDTTTDEYDTDASSLDTSQIDSFWQICRQELGHVVVCDEKTEVYKTGWIDTCDDGDFSDFRLERFECPSNIIQIAQQRIIANGKTKVKDIVRTQIPPNEWWTKTSGEGLMVPIGMQSGADIQYFSLGNGSLIHNALVGGSVGTGKTILLHDLILNSARLYSPSELRMHLLDYKEGTEFSCYKTLPHLDNLSIGPNVEFGLDVLNSLSDEIVQRAKLFKKVGVNNIQEYRNKTGEQMPRHLVVIDEFQVLWTDSVCGEQASSKMENLVRRGRSFGLNFILSTQSLRGANLSAAAKENLGLRICLRLSESDCEDFLSPGNMIAAGFTKAGEAVYNDRGGLPNGNLLFRSAYLGGSEIVSIIDQLREKALEMKYEPHAPNIYESDEFVPISELAAVSEPGVLCIGRTKGLRPVVVGLPIVGDGFRAVAVIGGSKDKRDTIFSAIQQQLSDKGIEWRELQDGSLKDETDRWRRWNEGVEPVHDCPMVYVVRNIDRLKDSHDFDVQAALGGMIGGAPAGASSLLVLEALNINVLLSALNGVETSSLAGIIALDEDAVFEVASKTMPLRMTEAWWVRPSMEEGRKVTLVTRDL